MARLASNQAFALFRSRSRRKRNAAGRNPPKPAVTDRSWLPEPLRWDAERPVEARGRVLPRDDHRQLRDGVVVVMPLHAREELVVDVAARLRDRVGVFERHFLRVAEERALRVVVERLQLLRRDAEPAAHGSIGVLSELAAVPPGNATVEQRPKRTGHARRVLLEGGPHLLRGAKIRGVVRVEEIRIERRAPELALFLEHFAQVLRERPDVDRRDARFPFQHGCLLHVRLRGVPPPVKSHSPRAASGPISAMRGSVNHGRDLTSETVGHTDEHFGADRSVYRGSLGADGGGVANFSAARLAFPAVTWFGRVDAEGLLEAPASRRGDDYGVAALHPFHPAEIEVTLGDRGPYRTRDVWASLGPIEAESAKVTTGRTQCGNLDPELGEKTGACSRDFSGFVVEHDVFAGDERIGEIDAEAARKVVVANSGRTERACLAG